MNGFQTSTRMDGTDGLNVISLNFVGENDTSR
jgi:hypothetical protein